MELVWLDSALNDLVRVRSFIAEGNKEAAKRAADTIKNGVQKLIEFPEIGKPVEDLPEYRDLFIRFGIRGYILRYRLHANSIYIIHIRHVREFDFKVNHFL